MRQKHEVLFEHFSDVFTENNEQEQYPWKITLKRDYCCNTTKETKFLSLKCQRPCAVNLLFYIFVLYIHVLVRLRCYLCQKGIFMMSIR